MRQIFCIGCGATGAHRAKSKNKINSLDFSDNSESRCAPVAPEVTQRAK